MYNNIIMYNMEYKPLSSKEYVVLFLIPRNLANKCEPSFFFSLFLTRSKEKLVWALISWKKIKIIIIIMQLEELTWKVCHGQEEHQES